MVQNALDIGFTTNRWLRFTVRMMVPKTKCRVLPQRTQQRPGIQQINKFRELMFWPISTTLIC